MVTKEDVREIIRDEVPGIVALKLKPIRADLEEIRKHIAALQEKVAAHAGCAKEIDHILERARYRAPLDIKPKAAA